MAKERDEITHLRAELAALDALLAENEALKNRLTIYEGQESTPDAPLGMTGVVADMAAEIKALKVAQAEVKREAWNEAVEACRNKVRGCDRVCEVDAVLVKLTRETGQ